MCKHTSITVQINALWIRSLFRCHLFCHLSFHNDRDVNNVYHGRVCLCVPYDRHRNDLSYDVLFWLCALHRNQTCDVRPSCVRLFSIREIRVRRHISYDRLSYLRYHRISSLCCNRLYASCNDSRWFSSLFCVLSCDRVCRLSSLFSIRDDHHILHLHRGHLFFHRVPVIKRM